MEMTANMAGSLLQRISKFAPWLVGWAVRRRDAAARRTMEAELARLEQTAPHLLGDIGFVEDPRASGPARRVLRARQLRLDMPRETRSPQRHGHRG